MIPQGVVDQSLVATSAGLVHCRAKPLENLPVDPNRDAGLPPRQRINDGSPSSDDVHLVVLVTLA